MDHNVVNRDLVDNRHGGGNGTALEGACFRSLDQLHDLLHVIRDRVILDWLKLVLDVADERGDQSVLVLGVLSCLYKEPFILLSCAFSVDEVGFHWAEKGVGVRRNYNLLFDPLTLPLFFREDDCENVSRTIMNSDRTWYVSRHETRHTFLVPAEVVTNLQERISHPWKVPRSSDPGVKTLGQRP